MEMQGAPNKRIQRPRQIYTGAQQRKFVPVEKR
jgi:citrate synthase